MINELYIYKRESMIDAPASHTMRYVGIMENYKSIIWHEKFYDKGEFKLVCPFSLKNLELLRKGNLVLKNDMETEKYQVFMEITQVEITSDDDEGDIMHVSGVSSSELLGRRIIWDTKKYVKDNVVDVIYDLVASYAGSTRYGWTGIEYLLNTSDNDRNLDIFILTKDRPTINSVVTMQRTGDNLLDVIKQLCIEHKIGFRITTLANFGEKIDGEFVTLGGNFNRFQIIVPTDRSKKVIFSDDYDNIFNASYVSSSKNNINTALVAGQGEGTARKKATFCKDQTEYDYTGNSTTIFDSKYKNFDRYETYVDVRDSNADDLEDTDYYESLRAYADDKFGHIEEAFDCELYTDGVFKFGKDFFLGDFVTIDKYGMKIKAQVIESIESVDDTKGYTNTPIFAW